MNTKRTKIIFGRWLALAIFSLVLGDARAQQNVTIVGGGSYVLKNPTAATFTQANGIPTLTGNQTWSGVQTFNGNVTFTGTVTGAGSGGGGDVLASNNGTEFTAATFRTNLSLLSAAQVNSYFADPTANGSFSASVWRTGLGLVIGTNVQAYDADLTIYAGITPSANVQSFLGAANYAAIRTQLALTVGTDIQAFDADLTALAALSGTNTIYYRSASNTWTAVTVGTGLAFTSGTLSATGSGVGDVTAASAFGTDNRLLRSDGTGKGAQSTGITVDDSDNMTGINGITATSVTFTNMTGTVPDANIASTIARDTEVTAAVAAVTGGNLSQFASTTSAQMRTLISDEQGTGPLQFNVMTTGGDIIYGGSSGAPARLANGSAGQVLQANGTTLAPTWVTPSAGSGNVTAASPYGTDNIVIITDGTGRGTKASTITVSGGNNIGVGNVTANSITANTITGVMPGANGGTGVANTGKTLTLGASSNTLSGVVTATGDLVTSGAFSTVGDDAIILRTTAATDITLPTTGTVATTAGAETLTNKLVGGVEAAISASAIDFATASTFTKTLSANTTFTFSNVPVNRPVQVAITNTASNYTATWPSVLWVGSSAPTLTTGAKTDRYEFEKIAGSIYGRVIGQNYPLSLVPVITSALTASGTEGVALTTYNITGTNSPTSYSATGLPSGLSVNTGTGAITGTPAAAGVSNITIGAINASGTGTDTLVLTVAAAGGGPTLIATDNFDAYANNYVLAGSANWTANNGSTEVNNPTTTEGTIYGDSNAYAHYAGASFSANQRAEITIAGTMISDGYMLLAVRCDTGGADTAYLFYSDGATYYLLDKIAGVQHIIQTGSLSGLSAGSKLSFEANGTGSATRLKVQKDTAGTWVDFLTGVDPTADHYIDGGKPGVGGSGNIAGFRATVWSGYDL